jgi:hypothetical protein
MDDHYNCAFSVLQAAAAVMRDEGMEREDVLPVFADFTAAMALSIGGVETVQLAVDRMMRLVEAWKSGACRSELH